jgi:RNA polymerase sigma-70 factor (ECF subfamily)
MAQPDRALDVLLDRAGAGDRTAAAELLQLHRERLKRMVAVRMDRRLAARLDPSDVVQEALALANQHLPEYAQTRPIPFYPWLRRLAWERMMAVIRQHIGSHKRSVSREEPKTVTLPDESAMDLAERLAASGTSPSGRLTRKELRERIHAELAQLEENDREVLMLRYLEQLSTKETAAVLEISEGGVKSRLMRALIRLRERLSRPSPEPNDHA